MDFKCPSEGCGLVFLGRSGLELHEKQPHEKCPVDGCGKAFVLQSLLKLHIKTVHKLWRAYKCEVDGCGERFGLRTGLAGHVMLMHDGPRDEQCEVDGCGKAFVRPCGLKSHSDTVHGKRRKYPCEVDGCGMVFVLPGSLRAHSTLHGLVPECTQARVPAPAPTKVTAAAESPVAVVAAAAAAAASADTPAALVAIPNRSGSGDALIAVSPNVSADDVATPGQVMPAVFPASESEAPVQAAALPPVPVPVLVTARQHARRAPAPYSVSGILMGGKRTSDDTPACPHSEASPEAAPVILPSKRARLSVTDGGACATPGAVQMSSSRVSEEVLRRVREVVDAARGCDGKFNVDEVVSRLAEQAECRSTDAKPLTFEQINFGIVDMISNGLIVPSHILRSDVPTF